MLMLVRGWRRIVLTMTAFTATHSLTLTAATLGWVNVPQPPVEPCIALSIIFVAREMATAGWVNVPQPPVEACIALSIIFVAREIVQAHRRRAGLTARWPWAV